MRRITVGSFDERDQLEPIPRRGHARTSKPKLRCINSAHSQFVRGGMTAAWGDDDFTAVGARPATIGVSHYY